MKEKITKKIREAYPHFPDVTVEKYAIRLMDTQDFLVPNLIEWIEGKDFTDIWVRDKHCIGSVLHLRGTKDFLSAFTALDDYAKDEAAEAGIWRMRL